MIEEILFGMVSLIYIILCILAIHDHIKLIHRLKSNNYKLLTIIVTLLTAIIFISLLYCIRYISIHYIFNYDYINLGHKLISLTIAFLFSGLAISCFYTILKTIFRIIRPKSTERQYSLKANIVKISLLFIIGLVSFMIWYIIFKSIFL